MLTCEKRKGFLHLQASGSTGNDRFRAGASQRIHRPISEVAGCDKSQVSSGTSAVAAVAEKGGNVAGGAPSGVLDALLPHTRREKRRLHGEAQIEVRSGHARGVVGGLRTEERAEQRGQVRTDFVAAAADARTYRGEHLCRVRAGDVLKRPHAASGDGDARA